MHFHGGETIDEGWRSQSQRQRLVKHTIAFDSLFQVRGATVFAARLGGLGLSGAPSFQPA
jgi:hypothetical protein